MIIKKDVVCINKKEKKMVEARKNSYLNKNPEKEIEKDFGKIGKSLCRKIL